VPSDRGNDPAMRILLVEDEPKMARLIRRVLEAEGMTVDHAADGLAGLQLAAAGTAYDVVVLDWMLPDIDGIEVLRLLRGRRVFTPVLMLTALGSLDRRVEGLEAGADDYLAKPFAFAELLARIRALARRPAVVAPGRLSVAGLELDESRLEISYGGRSAALSAREFALLGYLMRNRDCVLSRRQLLDAVWGAEPDTYSNVVDLYVHYLRRKLDEVGAPKLIKTVRGVGYRLAAVPERGKATAGEAPA
jgi:two-component system copper resistance phosphate regulon response regulator CusR